MVTGMKFEPRGPEVAPDAQASGGSERTRRSSLRASG